MVTQWIVAMNSDATIHHLAIFDINLQLLVQEKWVSRYCKNNGNTLSQGLWHFVTTPVTKCYELSYCSVTD